MSAYFFASSSLVKSMILDSPLRPRMSYFIANTPSFPAGRPHMPLAHTHLSSTPHRCLLGMAIHISRRNCDCKRGILSSIHGVYSFLRLLSRKSKLNVL
jgi:hypothetical protein